MIRYLKLGLLECTIKIAPYFKILNYHIKNYSKQIFYIKQFTIEKTNIILINIKYRFLSFFLKKWFFGLICVWFGLHPNQNLTTMRNFNFRFIKTEQSSNQMIYRFGFESVFSLHLTPSIITQTCGFYVTGWWFLLIVIKINGYKFSYHVNYLLLIMYVCIRGGVRHNFETFFFFQKLPLSILLYRLPNQIL